MQASGTLICPAETPQLDSHAVWRVRAESLLVAFLLALFAVRGFIPAWRHLDSDFANYYLAAHVYREGYPVERIYDWTWFQRQKDHLGLERPLVGFAPSTLPSILPILPLSSLPPLQANRCWLVISLGSLFLAVAVLKKITDLTWRRIGVLTFLAIAPLHNNFLLGQVHILMFLLLALAAWLYFRDRPFLSGIVLAAAAAMKIYPAFFLLFFLVKRQWRAAAGLACGVAGAWLLSLYLFGETACRTYFREILPAGLRGEIIDPYATAWDSLSALLRRLFVYEPELNPAPVAHLPMLYALLHPLLHSLILVVFLWAMGFRRTSASRQKLEWAIYCFLLLLLSSEPLPYHFVILILTAVLTVDYLVARKQSGWALAVVALYTLACVPYDRVYSANLQGWLAFFCFPRLFCMLLLAGTLLWILISTSEESLSSRLRSRSLAWAGLTFLILTTAGFVLDRRHLAGQYDNYATRVTTSVGSAIAVNPVVSGDAVLFEALVPQFTSTQDTYVIRLLRAGVISSYGGNGDWFYPASTIDGSASYGSASYGSASWAEVASKDSSRIIRFDSASVPPSSEPLSTDAVDAEQPAVSANGKQLAYIREVRGRGSLWIHPIAEKVGTTRPTFERELAGPRYDVREAAFSPDAQIIFSSSQSERYRLYSVDPQSGNVVELTSVTCSARYPAASSDGHWIAFSCERGGVWQITVMNRATAEQHQLTSSDCNSITPAWLPDARSLIYATDCGRALGITALSKLSVAR
jgi:hypothetical protein